MTTSSQNPFFVDKTTVVPADFLNTVSRLVYEIFQTPDTIDDVKNLLGLKTGSLASQMASSVNITGGFIDGVTIGQTNPSPYIRSQVFEVLNNPVSDNQVLNLKFYKNDIQSRIQSEINSFDSSLGTLSKQNSNTVSISGGSVDNTDIGTNFAAKGFFSSSKVFANPSERFDVVNLSSMQSYVSDQLSSSVNTNKANITGGSINNTPVGASNPSTGNFTTLKCSSSPSNLQDVVNLEYLTSVLSSNNLNLGTMASQNADLVSVTGGVLNNVVIGNISAGPGSFSSLTVNQEVSQLKLSTLANNNNSVASVQFLVNNTNILGELSFVPSVNSTYPPAVSNTVLLSGVNGASLKGQNAIALLNNAYGLGMLYGGTGVAASYASAPSASFGANSGFRGVTRYYGNSTQYSVIQAVDTNLFIDSNGTISLNSNIVNAANISLVGSTYFVNNVNSNAKTVFNNTSYDAVRGGNVQMTGGFTVDSALSSQLLVNTNRNVSNILSNGLTLTSIQPVTNNRNSGVRLVNLWDSVSSDTYQNCISLDFTYQTGTTIFSTTGSDSRTRVSGRVGVISAGSIEPRAIIELDNPSLNRMVVAAAISNAGHLILNERADDGRHSVQATDPMLASGYDKLVTSQTLSTPTTAIDLSRNRTFDITLASNSAVTFSGLVSSVPQMVELTFLVRQDSTGNKTLSFGPSVTFTSSSGTLNTAANSVSVLKLFTVNAGSSFVATYM